MKKFLKENQKTIIWICSILVMLIILIGGYKVYQHHQNVEARKAVIKVCNSTPPLAGISSDFQIADINAHKKIVAFQMNEEMSNALKSNINSYVEDHVSTISRLIGEEDRDSDNEGNLVITGTQVQPLCYAIASNKTFVNKWGKDWTVKVYNAQGKLVYIYRDDKFLAKPEDQLDSVIAEGQKEHDDNAAEITKAVINAVGNTRSDN